VHSHPQTKRPQGHPVESRSKMTEDLERYREALMIAIVALRCYADGQNPVYQFVKPSRAATKALGALRRLYGDLEI
jgi:hypothetical protein